MTVTRLKKLLWASVLICSVAQGQGSADEIDRLLQAGPASRAYEFALSRLAREAGNPRFDMALARAAMAAGHPEQAVFALERVLAQEPENHRARLELARAELTLGNHVGARQALHALLARNLPGSLRQEALELLAKVEPARTALTSVNANAEFKLGHDTNVNSANGLGSGQVYTPAQLFQIVGDTPIRDYFSQIDAAVRADRRFGANVLGFANFSATTRDYLHHHEFDNSVLDMRAGGLVAGARHSFRLTGQWQQYYLDGTRFRALRLFTPEWIVRIGDSDRAVVFGQFGALDYPTQPQRDVDLQITGLAWMHGFTPATVLMLSIYRGIEEAGKDDASTLREHFGRDYIGWRARLQSTVNSMHSFYLSVAGQHDEHAANDPLFLVRQEDSLRMLEAGWAWTPVSGWTFKADVSYYDNNSNIQLYEYDRTQIQFSVIYSFL